jgi:hypothetical protein
MARLDRAIQQASIREPMKLDARFRGHDNCGYANDPGVISCVLPQSEAE